MARYIDLKTEILSRWDSLLQRTFFLYLFGAISALYFTLISELLFPLTLEFATYVYMDAIYIPLVVMVLGHIFLFKHKSQSDLSWYLWFGAAVMMFGFWSGGYFLIGHLTTGREVHTLFLNMDREIGFFPVWVFVYLTVYLMFLLPFFVAKSRTQLMEICFSYLLLLFISYIIFLIFPVSFERSDLKIVDISTWTINLVYSGDPTCNCFPSTHCGVSLLAAFSLVEINKKFGFWAFINALAIGVSTLFIKQHFILDVVGGFVLAVLVHYILKSKVKSRK